MGKYLVIFILLLLVVHPSAGVAGITGAVIALILAWLWPVAKWPDHSEPE